MTKVNTREIYYTGAGWSSIGIDVVDNWGGTRFKSLTSGDGWQYTFFGTGCEVDFYMGGAGTGTLLITMDGSAPASATLVNTAGGWSYSAGTATATTGGNPAKLAISGLTLGLHTVRMTLGTGSEIDLAGVHVITPIHSVRSNIYADLQNTLAVGSNGISDDRQTQPIKSALPAQKAWAQATSITAGPTTTSTTFVPMPDMSITIKTSGGPIQISYSACLTNSGGNETRTQLYVDGVAVGNQRSSYYVSAANNIYIPTVDTIIVPVSAGTHKIDLYWFVGGGTATALSNFRDLVVREI
jgi:hypothetical protein